MISIHNKHWFNVLFEVKKREVICFSCRILIHSFLLLQFFFSVYVGDIVSWAYTISMGYSWQAD